MRKSSHPHKCLTPPKNFMSFNGPRHPQFNPKFEVKEQWEPTTAMPIRRRHAMGGAASEGSHLHAGRAK